MLERCAGSFAVILENQDVLETTVLLQIEDAITERPQNVFDTLGWQGGQGGVMVRRFNNYFVRADAVHFVEHAFGLSIEVAFNSQSWKLVWNYPYGPSRGVARRRRSAILARTVSLDLRRRLCLISI